ncbi:uncharacterized protein LOC143033165 [Oratosquilla oratoria]|uniref:uncharacterized protein LOC143033165 n=1 Tax=Oratosquilla oratoria TaxID=337810 RepID=UPI003F75E020
MLFSILECNFKASRITGDLVNFTHALSLLKPEILTEVSYVIASISDPTTPYTNLKTALLKRPQSSVSTRLLELLSKEELGSEKPSDLLRRMKQLLGDKYQPFDIGLFSHIFYQRLPPAVQHSLFSVKAKLSPDELANLTDGFMTTIPDSSVAAITLK